MKTVRKILMCLIIMTCLLSVTSCTRSDQSSDYKYYSQNQLREAIENNSELIILDIQIENEFDAHHIEGALATYAFPVVSDDDKKKLDDKLKDLEGNDLDIVIVCPLGKAGAERTYDYLINKGISVDRLFILEEGQSGWALGAEEDLKNTETTEET